MRGNTVDHRIWSELGNLLISAEDQGIIDHLDTNVCAQLKPPTVSRILFITFKAPQRNLKPTHKSY